MARYLYLDTETGGLSATKDALLTIGLVAHDDDKGILGTAHILVQPEGLRVQPGALKVNRIDMDEHVKYALSRKGAAEAVVEFVQQHFGKFWKNAPVMIGHNVKFDVGFMEALFEETDVKCPYSYHVMCTMGIALFLRDLGKIAPENVKLVTLMELYGIDFPEESRHTSLGDATATRSLHLAMREHAMEAGVAV